MPGVVMYINEVQELVEALAVTSATGAAHADQIARVEDLGIHITEKLQELETFGTTPGEVLDAVDEGEVSDSTFIACVNAALWDMA